MAHIIGEAAHTKPVTTRQDLPTFVTSVSCPPRSTWWMKGAGLRSWKQSFFLFKTYPTLFEQLVTMACILYFVCVFIFLKKWWRPIWWRDRQSDGIDKLKIRFATTSKMLKAKWQCFFVFWYIWTSKTNYVNDKKIKDRYSINRWKRFVFTFENIVNYVSNLFTKV